ncbi:hypothetical protein CDL12_00635 [Handroanthus impetiginosus]|uniref:Uncharacterized protein n=1 Tax=Handroanthus impetiginosus TaxID=429701 RepID=A0A2G9IA21_9LAMI|nr:hypothetical protein CDL12_00635 [Handroanthus impetiginosus]
MGKPPSTIHRSTTELSPSPSPSPSSSSSSPSHSPPRKIPDESEDLQRLEHAPPFWRNPNTKKTLSKQMSMCEVPRNQAWERRRRQFLERERRRNGIAGELTDDDLSELKGCIELGFSFNEENGKRLRNTIPALDLYFAVNRQLSCSPISSPGSNSSAPSLGCSTSTSTSTSSVLSPSSDDSLKIFNRGDDPQQMKTKLRHWAQAVACSVMECSLRGGNMSFIEEGTEIDHDN